MIVNSVSLSNTYSLPVFRHFTTTFVFFPFKTRTIKPWHIDQVHEVLKIHEFDDILDRYQEIIKNNEVEKFANKKNSKSKTTKESKVTNKKTKEKDVKEKKVCKTKK